MTLLASAPSATVGRQKPRHCSWPESAGSAGSEAVDLACAAGLDLDPWQRFVLERALGERADGSWAAFEVGLIVPRQNGKGAILEARELAGLFLLGERLIIHSAHEFATSLEAFHRLKALLEGSEEFSAKVRRVSSAHGEEGIELTTGQRIRFRTRTKGGGRGFSCDCLILDEAMDIPYKAYGALLPTLSARPNPQVWYTGSAVDQHIQENGLVLAHVRNRGIQGADGMAFFEWSAGEEISDEVDTEDEDLWMRSNPGLGYRITSEHIAREERAMDQRTFMVERLGIGDWPALEVVDSDGISVDEWRALEDPGSSPREPVCFAFDVRPDRSAAAVCVAGLRDDGLAHVAVVDHRPGTGWVPGLLQRVMAEHERPLVVYDQFSPAATLVKKLADFELDVQPMSSTEHAQACGAIFDAVKERTLRHLGTKELETAVRGASKRPLGEAWAWSRKNSTADISPLVAATLAFWGIRHARPSVYESRGVITV